jgi:hypothetical protein
MDLLSDAIKNLFNLVTRVKQKIEIMVYWTERINSNRGLCQSRPDNELENWIANNNLLSR